MNDRRPTQEEFQEDLAAVVEHLSQVMKSPDGRAHQIECDGAFCSVEVVRALIAGTATVVQQQQAGIMMFQDANRLAAMEQFIRTMKEALRDHFSLFHGEQE